MVKAPWGPIDEVRAFNDIEDIKAVYGTCIGTEAATAILEEGASKVYIYRTGGTGGAKASAKVGNVTVNAKYEGDYPLKIKIQKKPGDDTIKQCYVLINNGIKESYNFTAGESDSTELTKTLSASDYVDVSDASAPEAVAETEVELSGGKNPTVTAESYTKAVSYTHLDVYKRQEGYWRRKVKHKRRRESKGFSCHPALWIFFTSQR